MTTRTATNSRQYRDVEASFDPAGRWLGIGLTALAATAVVSVLLLTTGRPLASTHANVLIGLDFALVCIALLTLGRGAAPGGPSPAVPGRDDAETATGWTRRSRRPRGTHRA